jgi:hypothetical protein
MPEALLVTERTDISAGFDLARRSQEYFSQREAMLSFTKIDSRFLRPTLFTYFWVNRLHQILFGEA